MLLLLARGIQQWMTAIKTSSSHGVIILLMAALFLTACGQNSPGEATAVPSPTPAASEAAPPATATAQTMDSAITAAPTAPPKRPSERDTASQDIGITAEDIQLYPVSKIISGDIVTFQVQPDVPEEVAIENVTVDIYVDGQLVSADHLAWRNWDGKAQGFFEWVWDTSGLPGYHDIRVVLDGQDLIKEGDSDPTNNETTFSVRVGKSSERPLEERDAS